MRNKNLALLAILGLTIIGIPVSIYVTNKQQELRSRANTAQISSCSSVSFDGQSNSQSYNDSMNATFKHTTPNKQNRLLLVTVHDDDLPSTQKVRTITYAGTALTKIKREANNSDQGIEMWYLVNPPTGENSVMVDWETKVDGYVLSATSYSNIDQTMPIGSFASNKSASGNPSISMPLQYKNSAVATGVVHDDKNITLTPASNITQRYNVGISSNMRAVYGDLMTDDLLTSVNLAWNATGSSNEDDDDTDDNKDWALIAVELKKAVCPNCSDNIDNDNNGFLDSKDSSCHTDGNPLNPETYDPSKNGELGDSSTCGDSIDNNGDGPIDGADPVCHTDGNPGNTSSYNPDMDEITPPTPTPSPTLTPVPSDTPTPEPSATLTPVPTCTPRPECLEANPACQLPEPIDGWCPAPSVTIVPTLSVIPTPIGTALLINGLLDGIGTRGDNSNPSGTLSNKNPLTPSRNITISIFDSANQLVTSAAGTISYSSTSGSFTGEVILANSVPTGNYIVKATTNNRLTRLIPGIQNIVSGQATNLPDAIFTAGDIIHDNKLNILDYNSLIDCYSDLAPATSCSDTQKKYSSDLNDDGNVNQFDYNLFLREIATQPGQ